MLANQLGEDIDKGINWGSKTMIIIFMGFFVILIVPLIISIFFEQSLIPNTAINQLFYIILVPVMVVAALVYVVWKKM